MTIRSILARRIWDSRGRPTVEVEVVNADGTSGLGMAPAGASRGSREAVELRDGGPRFGGFDVQQALRGIEREIAPALVGRDAADQAGIDALLIALDGTPQAARLGGNALVATSLAVLHAAAAQAREPLWRYLAGGREVLLPLPQIQIFGGGAHAGRRVDIQDFMVIATGARSFVQALEMTAEVYRAAGELMAARGALAGVADEGGWWPDFERNEEALDTLVAAIERAGFTPGEEVAIALDIAASEFGRAGRYRLALDRHELDSDGWSERLQRWLDRYPIVSIEDPWRRTTRPAWSPSRGPWAIACRWSGRLPGDQRRAGAGRRHPGRLQLRAAQAQPGRHRHAGPRGAGSGAGGRVRHHRFGAFRRDRGRGDRAPGHRLERRPAEGGLVRALRAHGEVERRRADRDAGRRAGRLRGEAGAAAAIMAGLP